MPAKASLKLAVRLRPPSLASQRLQNRARTVINASPSLVFFNTPLYVSPFVALSRRITRRFQDRAR